MKPERIEELLNHIGNKWFGGQRHRTRLALLTVAIECTQTRRQSFIEALVGTGIGFAVALLCQVFLMWLYGLGSTQVQDVGITLFFTGVSIIRGYLVRRFFNWRHHK